MSYTLTFPQELFSPAAMQHYEGQYDLSFLKAGPDLYDFSSPLQWAIDVTNTGDALYVTGTIEGRGVTSCARCLGPAEIDFYGEIEGYYVLDAQTLPKDMEADEYEILPDDHTIDLEPLFTSALLLDVPAMPLCNEYCLGLCAKCGKNLNEGPCDCGEENDEGKPLDEDNPFSVLKNYLA